MPHGLGRDSAKAQQLMTQLLTNFGSMTFQIVAERDTITWRLVDLRSGVNSELVIRTVRAIYPEAEI